MSDKAAGSARQPKDLAELVGDADRGVAVDHLIQHHVEGRLTSCELDERLSLALEARTAAGLDAATRGLPATPAPAAATERHRGPVVRAWVTRHRIGLAAAATTLSGLAAWWIS